MKSYTQFQYILSRKRVGQLFMLYGCALFFVVFLTPNRYRDGFKPSINLVPVVGNIVRFYGQGNENFWSYYIGFWGNIFGNIILFMPFGFLCKCMYPHRSSLIICIYGCLLSISIELTQLVLRIGVCDIDDTILNVLGVISGVILYQLLKKRRPRWFANV